jgi:octaprenyl-diphosphate synthase
MNIDEATYFDIIHKKTATLIASCLVNGAVSAGAEQDNIDKMYEYGVNLGLAFQIKDDIFDYQAKGALGKPTGNDIKENKLTLPLIHAMSKADKEYRKKILALMRKSKRNPKAVEQVIEFANHYGGIDYATEMMNDYKEKAIAALSTFPDSTYRDALIDMANFVVNRKK